jgi:hypothetical protein
MAYILELTDGTTTVDFIDECGTSPWVNLEEGGLIIAFPTKKQTWAGGAVWRQGRTLSQHSYENRTITLNVEIGGTTWDAIFDQITEINRLLAKARESQLTGLSADVELKYQIDTVSNPVWFDILDGDLVVPQDIMSVEKQSWVKCTNHKVLKGCSLVLQAKPFARGAEVTLVNAVTIKNSDDASNNNYVSWSSSAVDGDVPGPLTIQHERNYAGGDAWTYYWIGIRDVGTLSTFIHALEAEDATDSAGTTQGPNSKYSDDYYEQFSGIGPSSNYEILSWTVSSTTDPLSKYMGRFRALIIGESLGTNALWRIRIKKGLSFLRDYPWRKLSYSTEIMDLGVIELPPWNIKEDQNSGAFRIELYMASDASESFNVDALYLIPAEDYKFRYWAWRGYNQSNSDIVEDVGIYDQVHYLETDQYPIGLLDWKGLPLHATPGQSARLYFLVNDAVGGTHNAEFAADITVKHTPYYLNVNRGAD